MEKEEIIHIAFIDDHESVIDLMVFLLSHVMPNAKIIIKAKHGKDFISQLEQSEIIPDIAIVDLEMNEMGGIETVKWIKENHNSIRIIMFTQVIDDLRVLKIVKAGVNGYCEKGKKIEKLVKAIKIIHEGGEYFPGFVKDAQYQLNNNSKGDYIKGSITGTFFSEKELILINFCYQGLVNHEIAPKMGVSEKSIENYLHKLYKKMKVKTKAEMIHYAIQNNLIDVNESS